MHCRAHTAVNTCNSFSLASAGGVYGMVANAGADIFWGNGMRPLAKWVDDHVFFRIPHEHLSSYNRQRAGWCMVHAGTMVADYGMGGSTCQVASQRSSTRTAAWRSLTGQTPAHAHWRNRGPPMQRWTSTSSLSALGSSGKFQNLSHFGVEVPYLGFLWNLRTCMVHLLNGKRSQYLAAVTEWEQNCTHNLLKTQKLYRKLLHAALVFPAGCAHLTDMEAMLASFNNSPFLPCTPPQDMLNDLVGENTSSYNWPCPGPSPSLKPPSTTMPAPM